MKTYCSEEMVGLECNEWVPADVARELLEALTNVKNCPESDLTQFCISVDSIACTALAKACNT